ncbi:MAG TPA: hypothetical protein VKT49_07340 [Bryobacteraceae bacterium]|nr:hypothetical protein [Bryobacteraceae bacterium]
MSVTNGHLRVNSRSERGNPYPVRAEVEYRLKQGKRVVEVGRTQTVSLSGSQVVLDSNRRLAPGMDIELILTWPGPLGTLGMLALRLQGRTLAGRGPQTKVQIGRYGFEARTKPAARKPATPIGSAPFAQAAPFAS